MLETQAYACYVLALAGKPERAVMSRLSEVVNTPRRRHSFARARPGFIWRRRGWPRGDAIWREGSDSAGASRPAAEAIALRRDWAHRCAIARFW